MKKLVFVLILLMVLPIVFADGGLIIKDQDMWSMASEEQQYAAINYKDGLQKMILSIAVPDDVDASSAVWIFPVPATPDEVVIDVLKGFPYLGGSALDERAQDSLDNVFTAIRASQVYPIPFMMMSILGTNMIGVDSLSGPGENYEDGVAVFESIEKMGLTTELVSARDSDSFTKYVSGKNLTIPQNFQSIIDGYIGEDYSFVVTWISDFEKFKAEQGNSTENGYDRMFNNAAKNVLGVSITFLTDELYFPLKPTSVYGSERVPAVIYVVGYVSPELYPGLSADSEVTYYYRGDYSVPEQLSDFFFGEQTVNDLKYTKIKIDPPSKYLIKDLWIRHNPPVKVVYSEIIYRYAFWIGLVLFVFCSCLASYVAGRLVLGRTKLSRSTFKWWGLFNFLTIIGFSIASYFLRTKELAKETKEYLVHQHTHIFENPRKKQLIFGAVFAGLTIFWLLLGSVDWDESIIFLIVLLMVAVVVIIFQLSKEKMTKTVKPYVEDMQGEVKVFDLKKLAFLAGFNIVFSVLLTWILTSNYKTYTAVSRFFGFVAPRWNSVIDGSLHFFIIILIFTVSLVLLVFFDPFIKKKMDYSLKGIVIVQKDLNKFWFIIVFSVLFMVIATILFYLLKAFI